MISPSVSLVIPTYNRSDVLRSAIERVLAQDYADLDILVIDQTPHHPADLQRFLETTRPRFRYFRLGRPSITVARNVGLRETQGELIVYIDDDVEIPVNFVSALVGHFASPTIGGVMPVFNPTEGVTMEALLADASRLYETEKPLRAGDTAAVTWMSNSAVMYSRQALIAAGKFDEYFQGSAWCEDADVSLRVRRAGFQIFIDTRVRITHLGLEEGGCENRTPSQQARVAREHLEYFHYFVWKNRRFLGPRRVLSALYRQYRHTVLTRAIWRRGWNEFKESHRAYWNSFGKVRQALRGQA